GERNVVPDEEADFGHVKHGKRARNTAYDAAAGEDGIARDPKTGEPIPRNGKWDMGHKPGYERWQAENFARARGMTEEEFRAMQRNPDLYRPETQATNRGHSLEDTSGTNNRYWKDRWDEGDRDWEEIKKARGPDYVDDFEFAPDMEPVDREPAARPQPV